VGGDGQLSGRDRVLAALMPLVLVVVALIAVERSHRVDQSPWQGIGFGMFASYEHLPGRTARATAALQGRRVEVGVPDDLRDDLDRVLVAPGDGNALALAAALRARSGADRLVLEVWGHDVDTAGPGLTISFERLRRVEVP